MKISDLEIENAGLVLLNEGNAFYDDSAKKKGKRVDVIRSFESKNIVACPGSGKTTTLLAKLIILSNKMPFDDGRGICVFTHTNVAIEKIKEELGAKSDILFSYPNFFGTIQAFINRYLAIPSFINKKGFRPSISNSKYYEAVKKSYPKDSSLNRIRTYIETQANYKKVDPYVFVANLRFGFNDPSLIVQSLLSDSTFVGTSATSYSIIKEFKEKIYDFGYLSFDDAYTEANSYLNLNPQIALAIQQRFKYVFVDEMQDSGAHQVEILDKLFNNKKDVVFQCYGDANQAIYNDGKNEGIWKPDSANSLYINDTKRFDANVGKVINKLRINYHNELPTINSSSTNNSLTPTIIVFDENKIDKVLPKYAEIIAKNGLEDKNGFYAVGRISKPPQNGSFSIKAYYPEYEKNIIDITQKFNVLEAYFLNNIEDTIKKRTDSIINSILYLLEENSIKDPVSSRRFTKNTFLKWLKEENEDTYLKLKSNLVQWTKNINNESGFNTFKKSIIDYYKKMFDNLWSITLDENLDFFVNSFVQASKVDISSLNKKSYTVINDKGETVDVLVNFNTVNGEKGRTHTSTLYLETYKNTYDVEKVMPYISGEEIKLISRGANKGKINPATPITHLKFAYVGMTRSTHLLCVAVRKNVISENLKAELISNGWSINEDLI